MESVIASSIAEGVRIMIQDVWWGQLKPNTLSTCEIPMHARKRTPARLSIWCSARCSSITVSPFSPRPHKTKTASRGPSPVYSAHMTVPLPIHATPSSTLLACRYGGWLLLVAYMHSQWSMWRNTCKLRVFVHARDKEALVTQARMMNMLQKFRIHAEVSVFDMYAEPSAAAMAACPDVFDGPEEEVPSLKSDWCRRRTKSHLRVGEVLLKQRQDSTFVYVTLPFPRGQDYSRGMVAWVDAITGTCFQTRQPCGHIARPLLMRGNQRNVRTYYA